MKINFYYYILLYLFLYLVLLQKAKLTKLYWAQTEIIANVSRETFYVA